MSGARRFLAAGICVTCMAANGWLAADAVRHVLVQLPLLGLCGWLATSRGAGRDWRWAGGGYAPLLAAGFGIAYWMLPRSIDAAIGDSAHIIAKFLTLPMIGALAAIGWRRAHPLLKAFVKAQAVSMAGFMAFLFTHAPARLCNNYLIDDQWRLGEGFLWLALALAALWSLPLFAAPATFSGAAGNRSRAASRTSLM